MKKHPEEWVQKHILRLKRILIVCVVEYNFCVCKSHQSNWDLVGRLLLLDSVISVIFRVIVHYDLFLGCKRSQVSLTLA